MRIWCCPPAGDRAGAEDSTGGRGRVIHGPVGMPECREGQPLIGMASPPGPDTKYELRSTAVVVSYLTLSLSLIAFSSARCCCRNLMLSPRAGVGGAAFGLSRKRSACAMAMEATK